jgi:hypothetical protein
VCKPGGWIEHYEISAIWTSTTPVPEDSPLSLWGKMFTEGGKKLGRSFTVIEDDIQIEGIKAAGFVDMVVKDFVGPLDDHTTDPKMQEVGKLLNLAVHSDLEGKSGCSPRCRSLVPLFKFDVSFEWREMEINSDLIVQVMSPTSMVWYWAGARKKSRRTSVNCESRQVTSRFTRSVGVGLCMPASLSRF